MALEDFVFAEGEVKAIKNGNSFLVMIGDKVACSMSTGGAHMFRLKAEAEHFGSMLMRGYTGGTFMSSEQI